MSFSQVHHYALLFGMGADAVCPYLCYHALFKARDEGRLGMKYTDAELTTRVKSAFDYGVRKVRVPCLELGSAYLAHDVM